MSFFKLLNGEILFRYIEKCILGSAELNLYARQNRFQNVTYIITLLGIIK